MSDGLVAAYSLVDDLPLEGEDFLCSHTLNKTVFGLKDSDPRQKPYPVRSMALVSSGSQVSQKSRVGVTQLVSMTWLTLLPVSVFISFGSPMVRVC